MGEVWHYDGGERLFFSAAWVPVDFFQSFSVVTLTIASRSPDQSFYELPQNTPCVSNFTKHIVFLFLASFCALLHIYIEYVLFHLK